MFFDFNFSLIAITECLFDLLSSLLTFLLPSLAEQDSSVFELLLIPVYLCATDSSGISINKMVELAKRVSKNTANLEGMERLKIGYARVSKREQAEDTNALKQQIDRLKTAGAEIIYSDVQKGKRDDRPQFQTVLQLIKENKVEVLYIVRSERITRSLPMLIKIVAICKRYGTAFIMIDQRFDSTTRQGKLMLNIFGTLAEWEVDQLSERVRNGKTYQRKQHWPYGICPFGYKVENRKYVLDRDPYLCLLSDRPDNYLDYTCTEEDWGKDLSLEKVKAMPGRSVAQVARDCIDMFFTYPGLSIALEAIFDKYGVKHTSANCNGASKVLHWTKRGFSGWLKNPVLEGHTAYNKTYRTEDDKKRERPREEWDFVYDTHADQRLMTPDEAKEIREILANNSEMQGSAFGNGKRQAYGTYSYQTGLIYCAECGCRALNKTIGSSNDKTIYEYFACRHSGQGCSKVPSLKKSDIEDALIAALVKKAEELSNGQPSTGTAFKSELLKNLEAQLEYLEKFPGFNPEAEELKRHIKHQIEAETNFFKNERFENKTVEEIILTGQSQQVWRSLSVNEKTLVFRRIVHKIFIRGGKVESILFNSGHVSHILPPAQH